MKLVPIFYRCLAQQKLFNEEAPYFLGLFLVREFAVFEPRNSTVKKAQYNFKLKYLS